MFRKYFFLDSIPYVQTARLCPEGVVAGGGQTRCWPCHVGGDAVGDQAATLHVPVIHRAVTDGPMWFRLKRLSGFAERSYSPAVRGWVSARAGGARWGGGRRPWRLFQMVPFPASAVSADPSPDDVTVTACLPAYGKVATANKKTPLYVFWMIPFFTDMGVHWRF